MDAWEARFDAAVGSLTKQISQLREQNDTDHSAMRQEMRTADKTLAETMRTTEASLREAIQAGDEETRRLMRVLHEDVIERIARIGERA